MIPIQQGFLPIHTATEYGNVAVAKELLNQNGESQVKTVCGPKAETVLHLATRRRDLDFLRLFTDQGIQVDARNVRLSLN